MAQLWVDLLLSAVGLQRIVDNDLLVIRESDKQRARSIPNALRVGWQEYFARAPFTSADPLPDGWNWKSLAARLNEEWAPVVVSGNLSPDELEAVRAACEERRAWVRANAPVRAKQTIVGVKEVPSSDVDIADFRRAWHVVDSVERLALDTWSGIVTGKQYDVELEQHPNTYEMSRSIAYRALAKRLAAKDSYKVPWAKEKALGVYLGTSLVDASLVEAMQSAVEQGEPQAPNMKPLDVDTKALATPIGRAEAR